MTPTQLDHLNDHAVFQMSDLFTLWRVKDAYFKHRDLTLKALAYVAETSGGKFAENCRTTHTELLAATKEAL
jgi:hypothetical protein